MVLNCGAVIISNETGYSTTFANSFRRGDSFPILYIDFKSSLLAVMIQYPIVQYLFKKWYSISVFDDLSNSEYWKHAANVSKECKPS